MEATTLVISWGIFGLAMQWSRSPQNRTAEEIVLDVLVVAGLGPVTGIFLAKGRYISKMVGYISIMAGYLAKIVA